MKLPEVSSHIIHWLKTYAKSANLEGFVVGVSGGVDSALTATLCAKTGLKTVLLNMPIHQPKDQLDRGQKQMDQLTANYANVSSQLVDLSPSFLTLQASLPAEVVKDFLSMANTRARLRMTTLYAVAQANRLLVAGTGNKVEDFGVGFFTKYGDGGVDLSPIADLMKTQVFSLAKHLDVIPEILEAAPTDGLWEDDRSDEDQIGATYPELEWAMEFSGSISELVPRQREVLEIFQRLHRINKHKMIPVPICEVPKELLTN